ncbi:TetR/AcrR family transcriptional regulator [Nocardia pseudobrasiliensis]|uniref:TetR family transcriptional regulator n=1 Tax=Nocardia pseudobrasiliensis TaxID=45979 RepID=A0A370ICB6_9NOCA|nr:TetR/AcrR family transcriptional regulator [Nocardia pseudobrasiliensis]RDI68356.1 TetR family transcriptional regulator [Nocardia pseudobrasiliensis]
MDTDAAPRRRKPRMPIEVRREEVLDAALRIILEQGYAAASMEAIARAAALAKPRVYAAFPDRDSLLSALWQREAARALADLAAAMPPFDTGDPETTLVAAFANLLRAAGQRPESWRLLLLPADGSPDEVRTHADATRAFARQQLRGLLEWGADQRLDTVPTDLELATHALLAAGEQLSKLFLTDPAQFPADRCVSFARDAVRAITPRRP